MSITTFARLALALFYFGIPMRAEDKLDEAVNYLAAHGVPVPAGYTVVN